MRKCTRRQFLEDSALAAAVAAVLPASGLLAAEKKEASPKSRGDQLRVAIVGCGGRGGEHIQEYLRHSDTEIAYIVDVDENIGRSRVKLVGKSQKTAPKFVRDLREALDDKSVDIVSIATPNHWHALAAI
jgi:hypothetical protein